MSTSLPGGLGLTDDPTPLDWTAGAAWAMSADGDPGAAVQANMNTMTENRPRWTERWNKEIGHP